MSLVYLESTVVSYYAARPSRDLIIAAHQQITIEWWESVLPSLDPCISQFVIDEISRGDAEAAKKRLRVIEDFNVLRMLPEIAELAMKYNREIGIPQKCLTDAYHMALSVYHGLDYLVTWNCTHIASARVRGIVRNINDSLGLVTPVICTPEELMEV